MRIATHSILTAEKQLRKGGCIKEAGGQGKNIMVSNLGKHTLERKSRQPVSCTVGNGEPLQRGTGDCTGLPAAPSAPAAEQFFPALRGREMRGLEMQAGDRDWAAKH